MASAFLSYYKPKPYTMMIVSISQVNGCFSMKIVPLSKRLLLLSLSFSHSSMLNALTFFTLSLNFILLLYSAICAKSRYGYRFLSLAHANELSGAARETTHLRENLSKNLLKSRQIYDKILETSYNPAKAIARVLRFRTQFSHFGARTIVFALHFGTSVQAVQNPIKPCSDRMLGVSGRPPQNPIAP